MIAMTYPGIETLKFQMNSYNIFRNSNLDMEYIKPKAIALNFKYHFY